MGTGHSQTRFALQFATYWFRYSPKLELAEATQQDPRLRPIVGAASAEARKLIHNPFNLWLVIHLLEGGASVNWLSEIQSEVQLLDRY